MKIGVITKREKAHKAGSVMQMAAELLRSRGVAVAEIYPEDFLPRCRAGRSRLRPLFAEIGDRNRA